MDFKKREEKSKKKQKMVTVKPDTQKASRFSLPSIDWSAVRLWSWRGVLASLVVGLVAGISILVPQWMDQYPIHRIQVMGDFQYVERKEMESRLDPYLQHNYFNVALKSIKQDAEQIPWVQSVKVSKTWPDTVTVRIQERVAIAIWNDDYLVSHKGELFAPQNMAPHQSLPRLYGNEKQVAKVMETYQQFSQIIRPIGREVAELRLEPRLSWYCELDNGLELLVDRRESLEKVKRFAKLYRQLAEVEPKMAKVDLRYRQGLAVTWDEHSEPEQNENI